MRLCAGFAPLMPPKPAEPEPKSSAFVANYPPSLSADSPQRLREHRETQSATRGYFRRSPIRFAGSSRRPVHRPGRRASHRSAGLQHAGFARLGETVRHAQGSASGGVLRSPFAREACWGRREAGDKRCFLELVSLLTIADEVRVPGGAEYAIGTLLCVFLSGYSVSLW